MYVFNNLSVPGRRQPQDGHQVAAAAHDGGRRSHQHERSRHVGSEVPGSGRLAQVPIFRDTDARKCVCQTIFIALCDSRLQSQSPAERADDDVVGGVRVLQHLQNGARQLRGGACLSRMEESEAEGQDWGGLGLLYSFPTTSGN